MEKEKLDNFEELVELIPIILKISKKCVNREINSYTHDLKRLNEERKILKEINKVIQGKWTIDIIYIIRILGESHYNDLKNILNGISTRMLADRLKFLEERRIIKRKIHDTRPIGVSYKLTDFGENIFHLLVPIFIYSRRNAPFFKKNENRAKKN